MRAIAFAAGLVGLAAMAAPAQAGLLGEEFHANTFFPVFGNVANDLGNAFVGPGLEFDFFSQVNFDLSDSQLAIGFNNDFPFNDGSFNGYRITDVDGSAGMTGITLIYSNWAGGFDADNYSLVGNDIFLNFTEGGIGFDVPANTVLVFDIQTGPRLDVPAPASLMLFGFGLAGLALRRRPG